MIHVCFETLRIVLSLGVEGKTVDTGPGDQTPHFVKGEIQILSTANIRDAEFLLHSRHPSKRSNNAFFSPFEERTARFPIVARKSAFFLPEIAGENQGDASRTEHLRDNGVARLVVDEMGGNMVGVGKVAGKIVLFVC